jgi:predicted dehydrogenase
MTVRVGFLGGGFIARYHAHRLRRSGADATVASVHDPDQAKAEGFATATGATIASTEQELVASVDAVYVCTWTAEHPRLVALAAAEGRPVFCEKPLAVDLAGADELVAAVEAAGVVNQVGLVLRDSPAFLMLRELVGRPESGRVMSVVFRDDQFIPIQGHYASNWRADPAKAGSGALLEHSIHDLDLLEWLFGPIVSGGAATAERHELAGIEDVAVATLQFASGAIGSLVSIWHDLLERPSLRRMEVFCERAYFWLENDYDGPVHWSRPGGDEGSLGGAQLLEVLTAAGRPPRDPDLAFIEAVGSDQPAQPDVRVARRAHVLAEVLYRSAAAGGSMLPVPPAS